jgi:hypothetical protein
MENLQQIVVQETTSEYKRALAQYGESIVPSTQVEIVYSELSDDEKLIYDNFINMIKSK